MKLSIELTMYPLKDNYLRVIEGFIDHLKDYKDIKIEVFPTCTVIMGEYESVMEVLSSSIKWSVNNKDKAVFISKFLPNYEAL